MDDSTYTVTVKVEDKNAKLTVTGVTVEKGGDDKSETLEVKNGKVKPRHLQQHYDAKGSVPWRRRSTLQAAPLRTSSSHSR